jgi:energy-coupling factor transporter ATP-binding protein EcfA2
MPRFVHIVERDYTPTFRAEKIVGMFDVPPARKLTRRWEVNLPIEEIDWQIGLIVGPSGSGKTTIARRAFADSGATFFEGHHWTDRPVVDDFSETLSVQQIVEALSHVGFSSPPAWLLPYHCLSNGQRFRADLARAILETAHTLVFDEFTSVVDRTVAKISAAAVQKFVRRTNKKFVAVTCHYDVAEWLEPDWVYDTADGSFRRQRLRRPEIQLDVFEAGAEIWPVFRPHHYLSAEINKSAKFFVAVFEDHMVAMTAILIFPHPTVKNCYREHRTVVLPDFQGVGIGNRLSEFVGDWLLSRGKRFISTTSHPAMIAHRSRSSKWILKRIGRASPLGRGSTYGGYSACNRLTASFEYLGCPKSP